MIFNKNQEEVINAALGFLRNNSEQVFQFSGEAGTGKSVVLNEIINRSGLDRNRIAPMAYIGQAAIVMRTKGLYNAKTIHSWLYEAIIDFVRDENDKIVYDTYHNKPLQKLVFVPREIKDIDLFIIDEAGSVPYELKKDIESKGKKIIACGDIRQLPPPCDRPAYLYEGKIMYLTEIMRQNKDSMILELARRAKLGLPIPNGRWKDCMVIYEDELDDFILPSAEMIVCGKNATREIFINKIRNMLGYTTQIPQYGEKLICRKNNWLVDVDGISLANGLIGTVVNSPDISTFDGKTFNIDFKPDLSDNVIFNNISCDYKYFVAPYDKKQQIKLDRYSTGEKFEYAYAITTHSSQGAQYRQGIYFEEYLNRDIQKNLNYTGITRFSDYLVYVKKRPKNNFYFS